MKNMGDMRKEIRLLRGRVTVLEAQVAALIESFCKGTFEDFEAPEKPGPPLNFRPEDVQLEDEDLGG